MAIHTETFTGAAIAAHIPALTRLRLEVFADWPYLYEGDAAEEELHLAAFAASPDAALVVAFDAAEAVGCSTCLPLAHEPDHVRAPFEERGWNPSRFCYFSESVLRTSYRGHGLGVAFFAAREAHAKSLPGVDFATFCSVRRRDDDPRRPPGATPLHDFWRKRGFAPLPGVACAMTWPEMGGDGAAVPQILDFWAKSLRGAPLP